MQRTQGSPKAAQPTPTQAQVQPKPKADTPTPPQIGKPAKRCAVCVRYSVGISLGRLAELAVSLSMAALGLGCIRALRLPSQWRLSGCLGCAAYSTRPGKITIGRVYIHSIYTPENVNTTPVKYHGGRDYKPTTVTHQYKPITKSVRSISFHSLHGIGTLGERKHPRNTHAIPRHPTPKPSLSLPLRCALRIAPSGCAYRRAPRPLAATCAAALSTLPDAAAGATVTRAPSVGLALGSPLGLPAVRTDCADSRGSSRAGSSGSLGLKPPAGCLLARRAPRQNYHRSVVR